MDFCRYKLDSCTVCKFVQYRDCSKFRRAHNNSLVRELFPFKYKKHKPLVSHVGVFTSSDKDFLKSVCADLAVVLNSKVKKLSLNQSIDLVLSSELPSNRVIYIEILKVYGDLEKIKSVFESFTDKALLQNKFVFVYSMVRSLVNDSWIKI